MAKPSGVNIKASLFTNKGALVNFTCLEHKAGMAGIAKMKRGDIQSWEGIVNTPTSYLCATDGWDDETQLYYCHAEVNGQPCFKLYYAVDDAPVYTTDRGYLYVAEGTGHDYILVDAKTGNRLDISKMAKETTREYSVYLQSVHGNNIDCYDTHTLQGGATWSYICSSTSTKTPFTLKVNRD